MANQVQVTVVGIGSNIIKGDPITLSFPTHLISVQTSSETLTGINGVNAQVNYYPNPNSQSQLQKILVTETVAAIGTLASTDMFAATVYNIDFNPQNTALDMLFPAVGPSIGDATGTNINSYIEFKGAKYYALETQTALVALANTGGGGGVTIYTGDGSLSGDRTVDLNGYHIQFGNGNLFVYDEEQYFNAKNSTGGGNLAIVRAATVDGGASFSLSADFNDGEKANGITGSVGAGLSAIEYTADTHTFIGDIINADLAGGGVTGASIDNDGKLIRTP